MKQRRRRKERVKKGKRRVEGGDMEEESFMKDGKWSEGKRMRSEVNGER